MVRSMVWQLWLEPPVADPPRRVWRDWVLVSLLVPAAILEAILRKDVGWRPVALVCGAVPVFTLLWRRTHPLMAVVVVFGAHALTEAVTLVGAPHSAMLMASGYAILLPYSLLRWASGRHAIIGMGVVLFVHVPRLPITWQTVGEGIGGMVFLLLPASLGAAMRYRSASRLRERDQAKLREREQLARELHDTVAHHVSAIIIQAQAGRTVAPSDPAAAVRALEVIEHEASRTLGEMRIMVSALRQGEDPSLSPQCGVADIPRLARHSGAAPKVEVRLSPGLDDLRPSLSAAVYRLAQESITNAVRHARHATLIDVSVVADEQAVRLTVDDDGDASAFDAETGSGYGLVGMAERASLLGGSLVAGPRASGGWGVTAVLPLSGRPS
jgi:signal transduction histidine kinase